MADFVINDGAVDKDGNILTTPTIDVTGDPTFKEVIITDKDGNKLATPVFVVGGGGGGGTGGDITGLVRTLQALTPNVTITETVNLDGTKNIKIAVDGYTKQELDSIIANYYTKLEVDNLLSAVELELSTKANKSEVVTDVVAGTNIVITRTQTPNGLVIGISAATVELTGLIRTISADSDVTTEVVGTNQDGTVVVKVTLPNYYTKAEVDTLLNAKANVNDVYTKNETDAKLSQKAFVVDTYSQIVGGSGVGVASGVAPDGSKTATISINTTPTVQRVKTLDDLGITETTVNALTNKPSITDDVQRRNSAKDFLFLISNALGFNDVLIENIDFQTRPQTWRYLAQLVEKSSYSSPTTRKIQLIVTKQTFEIATQAGAFSKKLSGNINISQNTVTYMEFQNIGAEDLIWDDNVALTQKARIQNYINSAMWYVKERVITIPVGTTLSQNVYKDCIALFNLAPSYSQGFKLTIYPTTQNNSSVNAIQKFELTALDNANRTLEFNFASGTTSYVPINISKMSYVRYSKTITATTINNGSTYQITPNMSVADNDANFILGAKDSVGNWAANNPTLANGLFFINHNRRVRIDIQLRMQIELGTQQDLVVEIRRGDGQVVQSNIGTIKRSPDTKDTTTNIVTFSKDLNDLFVTNGFELIITNTSLTTISLPAQTISVDFNLSYY